MGASPSIGLPDLDSLTNRGSSIRKRVPIVGRCFNPFLPRILGPRLDRLPRVERRRQFAPVTFITQEPNSAQIQASAVGVGIGSDGGAATRERGRLCLGFGSEAPSATASDFDPERVVRFGLGFGPTCSSTFAAADSAGIGGEAASAFGLRPRPSCFASVDRRSE